MVLVVGRMINKPERQQGALATELGQQGSKVLAGTSSAMPDKLVAAVSLKIGTSIDPLELPGLLAAQELAAEPH